MQKQARKQVVGRSHSSELSGAAALTALKRNLRQRRSSIGNTCVHFSEMTAAELPDMSHIFSHTNFSN